MPKQFRVKQSSAAEPINAASEGSSNQQPSAAASTLHLDSAALATSIVSSSANSMFSNSSSDNPHGLSISNSDSSSGSSSSSSSSTSSSSSASSSSISAPSRKSVSQQTAVPASDDSGDILTIRHAASVLSSLLKRWTSDDDTHTSMEKDSSTAAPDLDILNNKLINLLQQYQEAESAVYSPEEHTSRTLTAVDSEPTDDPLSVLEETLEEDEYSFLAPHSQPKQAESNQQSYSYATRSQTTEDQEIQITRVRPAPLPLFEEVLQTTSSSSSEELPDSNTPRTVKEPPVYVDDEMEQYYLNHLKTFLQDRWVALLQSSFQWFLTTYLEEQHPKLREELTKLFLRHLSPPLLIDSTEATSYYWHLSTMGDIENIFSILALNVVQSACSEASCERVFSSAKRIVGDRRQSLHLSTLSVLVHAALYKEY